MSAAPTIARRPTFPDRWRTKGDHLVAELGPIRLHTIAGVTAAVVVLSGEAWCAVADHPTGGLMVVFQEDL